MKFEERFNGFKKYFPEKSEDTWWKSAMLDYVSDLEGKQELLEKEINQKIESLEEFKRFQVTINKGKGKKINELEKDNDFLRGEITEIHHANDKQNKRLDELEKKLEFVMSKGAIAKGGIGTPDEIIKASEHSIGWLYDVINNPK